MSSQPESNKRIATNTLYMYIRLISTIVIGLYTYRIVINVLGISDYGLFNVVGGVLAMFTFFNSSLSAATTRFFNVEMGKADGNVNKSFNINLLLHIVFAVVIFVLSETFGLWYIYNKLNVEPGKLDDALFIFHVSIITTCIGITNGPYSSIFNAFERFKFLAILDIVNMLLRLVCIVGLNVCPQDSVLRYYTIIMCLTTANTFFVYHYFAKKNWPSIIKLRLIRGWKYYKEVLVFSNWNLLATLSYMAHSSGVDLLLNFFFGTTINGAYAISKNVNGYVSQLSANFDSASAPQITQAYASGNLNRCFYLVNKIGRFNLLLFEVIFFPLYIELNYILTLWLGSVPDNALLFTQINLFVAAASLSGGGIVQYINATGKIKWFKLEGSILTVLCIPIGFFLFKLGFDAYTLLVLFVISVVLQRIVQLILMKCILGFDAWHYVIEAYGRPFAIALFMSFLLYVYSFFEVEFGMLRFTAIIGCIAITSALVFFFGLTQSERIHIVSYLKKRYNGFVR